jgi:hypothetical protein
MNPPTTDRTELFLRYLRRLQYVFLAGITPMLFYGGLTVWDREGRFERLQFGLLILCPVILTLGLIWLRFSRKGNPITLKDPDFQAIAKDEFRKLCFERAFRVAFVVVMAVQVPLAWLLSLRPSPDSLFHMGTFTFFIGFIAFLTAFLFFDRD